MSPMAPRTPCRHPLCPALVTRTDKGFCEKHRKAYMQNIDQNRPTATARGYDSRWGRFRVWFLRQHPMCFCGCGRPAMEVHHLTPASGPDDPNFYNVDGLVALSKECHSRETMKMLNERRKA